MPIITVANFRQTQMEKRIDADYYRGSLPHNNNLQYLRIDDERVTKLVQYGLSIEMNENNEGYKIYRMNEIKDLFCSDFVSKCADISKAEMEKFKLRNNDVLFNRTNSYELVGRTGIFKEFSNDDFVFASYLVRLRANEKVILPEVLTVFLNTKFGIHEIKRHARISINQSNVSASELGKILTPIPPMLFQEEIRDALNCAFEKLFESRKIDIKAQECLLNHLGYNRLEIPHRLTFDSTLKSAKLAERFDPEFFHPKYDTVIERLKQYTEGYEELGTIIERLTNGVESREYCEDGVPYVRVNDLLNGVIDYGNIERISRSEACRLKHKISLTKNDVLLSRSGTLGLSAYVRETDLDSVLSSHIFRVRLSDDRFLPEYVSLFLRTFFGNMQIFKFNNGCVVPEISQKWVRRIIVPVVDKKLQETLKDVLHEADSKRERAREIIRETIMKVEEIMEPA